MEKPNLNDDILDFVKRWNNMYPIDYWWRKKHGVAFNSKAHKEQSVLDMKIEYEEDALYEQYINEVIEEELENKDEYKPGRGFIFKNRKEIKVSEEEAKTMFDEFDVGDIEIGDDGEIVI